MCKSAAAKIFLDSQWETSKSPLTRRDWGEKMRKVLVLLATVTMVASPAFGQVRPQDCRPMLPVTDDLPPVADVVAQPAVPVAAVKRSFFGLPFLLPLLMAGGGLIAAVSGGDDDNDNVSPA